MIRPQQVSQAAPCGIAAIADAEPLHFAVVATKIGDQTSMNMPQAPRLHIILANTRPRAVILRRGPSDWYHLVLWDTQQDTFDHGAWFRGRIYEERCDLSPDGELFLYFALQGNKWNTDYRGSWTAVSRPPWLAALTLWPQGDTWGGGGCFADNRKLILETGCLDTHPRHPLRGLAATTGRCNRETAKPEISGADWSGYDQRGFPIYTMAGRLYRQVDDDVQLLADFSSLEPNPTEAPDWAGEPL